jgi:colanic acid biosynthesis glycosyl transferase WcaI
MRFLVLGTNYTPEKTAVAPFATGLCEHLVAQGHKVTIITTFPYYPEWRVLDSYRGRLFQRECINGVRVWRAWHFVPSRPSGLVQRLAHDISFTVTAFLAALFAGGFDLIYCTCPPPTLAVAAWMLAKIHRRPYVIKLTDLASDAALATGILKNGLAAVLARAVEGFVYRKADRVVCLCQPFIEKLTSRGTEPSKLQLISDWADTEKVYPVDGSAFRSANGLSSGQFLVMHTGNMGRKQDLLNVIRAAEMSKGVIDLVWMLVGHGEERAVLEQAISRLKLTNVRLLPLQPAECLAEMYSTADVLLLNQRATIVDSVIPSKLLTYMAAGRTVLAAVSDQSETAQCVTRAQCGLIVHPEDPKALVDAVLSLRRDTALRDKLGASGRTYVQQHFAKRKVLRDYDLFFSRYMAGLRADTQASKNAVAAK